MIVSFIGDAKAANLRAALPTDWSVQLMPTWHDFVDASANSASVLVVDPPLRLAENSSTRQLTDAAKAFLSASASPTVIYTAAANAAACVAVPRVGPLRLVVAGVDDHPSAFRFQLDQAASDGAAHAIAAEIRASARFDPRILAAIGQLVEAGALLDSVSELASHLNLSRTALYRNFADAGVRSPLAVLQVLRVARLYMLLSVNQLGVRNALRILGGQDSRSLRRAARSVLGDSRLTEMRQLSATEFGRLCIEALLSE